MENGINSWHLNTPYGIAIHGFVMGKLKIIMSNILQFLTSNYVARSPDTEWYHSMQIEGHFIHIKCVHHQQITWLVATYIFKLIQCELDRFVSNHHIRRQELPPGIPRVLYKLSSASWYILFLYIELHYTCIYNSVRVHMCVHLLLCSHLRHVMARGLGLNLGSLHFMAGRSAKLPWIFWNIKRHV